MSVTDGPRTESRAFEADVAQLLRMMVHSVYSDRNVFLRELISNAADACEKLRYEAIAMPELLAEDAKPRITLTADREAKRLTVEDNGIGMARAEMAEALGRIAHSGTRAFMAKLEEGEGAGASLIGQFGVGFYSAFMVAERVEVFSRRAGEAGAARWISDGKGTFEIAEATPEEAPARGTRVVLHLMENATEYAERHTLERLVRERSGHVPVPIALVEKPGAEVQEIADGAALWAKPKSEITPAEYTDFYRSVAGQFDEPALTLHVRAEGRHEYTTLAFVPGEKPFDLFDPDRKGRMKLYVRRVFITDEADILPRWLRFVRGLVDSADLPLSLSREMIQASPILGAIRKGVTNRVVSELEKLAEADAAAYAKVWENFGAVIKEGLYEDFERREALLGLARFKTTASGEGWRGLKEYGAALKQNQTAIWYLIGEPGARVADSPHLEGFRARGIEVLLLTDPVDAFWPTMAQGFEGKPLKSVTQGGADLAAIPLVDEAAPAPEAPAVAVATFIAFVKTVLGEELADVRASERLTDSVVCLVAAEKGPDRQLERLLAGAGRGTAAAKPVLEINPRHELVISLAALGSGEKALREDAARLLYDEARILDGERPADPRAFSARLARVVARAARASGPDSSTV